MSGGGASGPPGGGEKKRNDLTTAVTVQTVSKKVDSRGGGEDPSGMSGCCSNVAGRACTKKQLQKKLPILSWLPKYTGNFAISDVIAGVTVGLTVIPQVIYSPVPITRHGSIIWNNSFIGPCTFSKI